MVTESRPWSSSLKPLLLTSNFKQIFLASNRSILWDYRKCTNERGRSCRSIQYQFSENKQKLYFTFCSSKLLNSIAFLVLTPKKKSIAWSCLFKLSLLFKTLQMRYFRYGFCLVKIKKYFLQVAHNLFFFFHCNSIQFKSRISQS